MVIFVKIEEKNDQLDDVIKRRKRHQIIFSNSLINSSNLYLQDLGSEIALSIMVQEFTCLQNGSLSVTPVSIYLYMYVCMYRCFTSNFVYIGVASESQEMRDL